MKKIATILGASLLLPASAFAASPNYNYIEGGYVIDGANAIQNTARNHYDGYYINFSGAILDNLFVQGSHAEYDVTNGFVGQDFTSLGVGTNIALPVAGFYAFDGYGMLSYELANDGLDGDGGGVTLGIRALPVEQFEINPFVKYVNYGQLDTGTPSADLAGIAYGVNFIVNVTKHVGLTASYQQTELNLDPKGGSNVDYEFNNEFRVGMRINL